MFALGTFPGDDKGCRLSIVGMLRTAFDLHYLLDVEGVAAEDDSAPVAGLALSLLLFGGEDDGLGGRALSEELAAPFDDECGLGVFVAFDDGTGFDGQFGTFTHIDPSLEEISAFLEGLLAGEDDFLVTVSDFFSVGVCFTVGETVSPLEG